jgi:hypothetical protein
MKISKTEQLKKGIQNSFEQKNKESLKLQITKLGIPNFYYYFSESEYFKKEEYKDFFWNNFLLDSDSFNLIFNSEFSTEFLFEYLTFLNRITENLAKDFILPRIIEINPDVFVKAVRASQSYLNQPVFEYVFNLNLPDSINIHFVAWKEINNIYNDYEKKINNQLDLISEISITDKLIYLVLWVEDFRFKHTKNLNIIETSRKNDHLISVYNLSIKFIVSSNKSSDKLLNETDFEDEYVKILGKTSNPLSNLLDGISEWVLYKDEEIIPYSYDMQFIPFFNKGKILFKDSDFIKRTKWIKGEYRYSSNQFRYKNIARDIVKYNQHIVPKSKNEEDKELNLLNALSLTTSSLLVDDLSIDKIKFKSLEISVREILHIYFTLSFNRLDRYLNKLENFKKSSYDIFEALRRLHLHSIEIDIKIYPFVFMSFENFCKLNFNDENPEIAEIVYKESINHLAYQFKKEDKINLFDVSYNVMEAPFIKINDETFIFCSTFFLAVNDWFYSLSNMILKKYKKTQLNEIRKSSSIEMEENLVELFIENKFKAKIIPSNTTDGDIDIIICDGQTQLAIQLKRTYFRLSSKEQYNEEVKSDKKAAIQLNNAFDFIIDNNNILKIEDEEIEIFKDCSKWIVSTSFENINEDFFGIKKVNYLEIIWVLKYSMKKFKSLKEFIEYIESDKILHENSYLHDDELLKLF